MNAHLFSSGYALLIGVGHYRHPLNSLPTTVSDVEALRSVLIDPAICAYPQEQVRVLTNQNASRDGILKELTALKNISKQVKDATILIYFSGHGWLHKPTGEYYLIASDVEPTDVARTALAANDFIALLRDMQPKCLLVMIDSCFAEGMASAKDSSTALSSTAFMDSPLPKGVIGELTLGEGRAIFTSCRGSQSSYILPDRSLSIFTHHLIEGLQGKGNHVGDDYIRVSDLMRYLGAQVPITAQTKWNVEQTPFFDFRTEDFPVALLLGGKGLNDASLSSVKPVNQADSPANITVQVSEGGTGVGYAQSIVINNTFGQKVKRSRRFD